MRFIFRCTRLPFLISRIRGQRVYESEPVCPFIASGAFLEAYSLPDLTVTILSPKLIVACMRSVVSTTHTKTPKTNHANAPVTWWVLCAISYLHSMQQQRLDEKLILPPSPCPSLSVCLYPPVPLWLLPLCLSVLIKHV